MIERNIDHSLQLVGNSTRRRIVRALRREPDDTMSFESLVERLREEREDAAGERTDRELRILLHHVHLPMLAEHDVVAYDVETRRLQYQPHESIETVLDALADELRTTV